MSVIQSLFSKLLYKISKKSTFVIVMEKLVKDFNVYNFIISSAKVFLIFFCKINELEESL